MIAELLAEGAGNARTGRELARYFNCDLRTITEQIEQERREGRPICASNTGEGAGYYLAANKKELQTYCRRIHKRAGAMYKTRRALLNIMDKLPGELETNDNGKI